MLSTKQRQKAEMMYYEYYEIHELEEVTLSNSRHLKTEMKDGQGEIQEIEVDAIEHTSSQTKLKQSYMYS